MRVGGMSAFLFLFVLVFFSFLFFCVFGCLDLGGLLGIGRSLDGDVVLEAAGSVPGCR